MKAILRATTVFFILSGLLDATAADFRTVTERIDQIIYDELPAGTDIGIMVYDLTTDSVLYAYRENVLFRPASTQKIITSIVALHSLGTGYSFETTLRTQGQILSDGTLDGDLYLVGGIDPALSEQELKSMVDELKKAGIRRINGNVYADVSQMDSVHWGSGWCWDDSPSSFQPYISPLMVHEGSVAIQVRPTENGKSPTVTVTPANRFIKVDNRSLCGVDSLGTFSISRDWIHNDNTIVISGNCRRRETKELSVVGTAEFTFTLFREYLDDAGISFKGYGTGVAPVMSNTLAKVSHSLNSVMKEALKESNNLYAEAMFLQLGRLVKPSGAGFKDASGFIDNYVARKFGFASHEYNIVDGCGLSMYDHLTPSFMVNMLRLIHKEAVLFPVFYRNLPISGMDGTLKTRMDSKSAINRVHAKTGSVTGACTLAGYLTTDSGHEVAFCIMNEGAIRTAPSRKVQDAICTALCELK
ncbi:MAG: D-alanyl-D-alanine carboxypeptidase/D-alanyl-D-alanine-endopeptidase [Bacteroidaceae bacterium]|nr:D-alanyl-D-alanine carboxypeptidase/D-alanyl-D-alanine-endopeptidase [Bacteroidaceae bacterium]